jgi:hypothetical protein
MIDTEVMSLSTVCVAHFSVQEYLESERMNSVTAHAEILQICLLYLLEPALASTSQPTTVRRPYPLADFAANYWYRHYAATKKLNSSTT